MVISLKTLFLYVAAYAAILLVSMGCSYLQAIILQKIAEDHLIHERRSVYVLRRFQEQLNEIPVGKLVTRTTNDTNALFP